MGKVKSHQKLPTEWNEREILRDKGQFWTPSWVADAMVAYVSQNTDLVLTQQRAEEHFTKHY